MDQEKLIQIISESLSEISYNEKFSSLYEPIKYTLSSGGKHIRPLLCLKACEAFSDDALLAISQALGIEMYHNFTLIHDDVMDKSILRRNAPTVYARNGATQAILSGDALLTLATQKVCRCSIDVLSDVLELFNETALKVYEGQQLDMDFETRDDVTTDEYLEMIRLKTSVLLGCACGIGALIGRACSNDINSFYTYGEKLGLAFQLKDDWLDIYGDESEFGKPIGNDIINRKKTWLFITAVQEAPHQMNKALESSNPVDNVKEIYDSLNLSERCNALITRYCDEAIKELNKLNISNHSWFIDLAKSLCYRTK